jgi:hypothetical protein
MSKFNVWMKKQSVDFIKEIYPDMQIPTVFRNTAKPITLKQLEELDNKFINNPEGNINGSTNV